MPASLRSSGGTSAVPPTCTNCKMILAVPEGLEQEAVTALIDAESARCARLLEITQQRQALAMRIPAGIAGILGSDRLETTDLIAHRQSLSQLEETLRAQFDDLSEVMLHKPHEVQKNLLP
jgi:hypothetical protein